MVHRLNVDPSHKVVQQKRVTQMTWVEAEPLTYITEAKTLGFMWKSIISCYEVPCVIVIVNGLQFNNKNYKKMCGELGIKTFYSSPIHPQLNEQVEAVNKTIKTTLKTKLSNLKGAWAEELLNVLWAYQTTTRNVTGQTPFSLALGTEIVVTMEIGMLSNHTQHF